MILGVRSKRGHKGSSLVQSMSGDRVENVDALFPSARGRQMLPFYGLTKLSPMPGPE